MTFPRMVVSMVLCVGSACGGISTAPVPRTSTNVITRSELDAVVRLRPAFIRDRGQTTVLNSSAQTRAVVFVNDNEYGPIESLKQFPASRAQEVRFLPGPEATTRFGSAYGSGIILLTLRVQ
jgi:hypothetical protein